MIGPGGDSGGGGAVATLLALHAWSTNVARAAAVDAEGQMRLAWNVREGGVAPLDSQWRVFCGTRDGDTQPERELEGGEMGKGEVVRWVVMRGDWGPEKKNRQTHYFVSRLLMNFQIFRILRPKLAYSDNRKIYLTQKLPHRSPSNLHRRYQIYVREGMQRKTAALFKMLGRWALLSPPPQLMAA